VSERERSRDGLAARLERWRAELGAHGLRTALLVRLRHLAGTDELATATGAYFETNDARVGRLEQLAAISAVMDWIEQATVETEPVVSVIMPTYNRAELLPAAIASVIAQSYPNWELIVVDDGSDDGTTATLEALSDPRVRGLRVEHGGVGAARNAGLDAARGSLVAYLDDDNAMHPNWLKSVVWAFEQRPEVAVLYGAIVIDDYNRGSGGEPALPTAALNPFDRRRFSEENPADISAIAHRAGLPGAHFDEDLVTMADWDLLGRLCAEREPLVLPAISCFYSTATPGRLTGGPTQEQDTAIVRERLGGGR
jgi:hypothetical protein